jgi:hypothetical protein
VILSSTHGVGCEFQTELASEFKKSFPLTADWELPFVPCVSLASVSLNVHQLSKKFASPVSKRTRQVFCDAGSTQTRFSYPKADILDSERDWFFESGLIFSVTEYFVTPKPPAFPIQSKFATPFHYISQTNLEVAAQHALPPRSYHLQVVLDVTLEPTYVFS